MSNTSKPVVAIQPATVVRRIDPAVIAARQADKQKIIEKAHQKAKDQRDAFQAKKKTAEEMKAEHRALSQRLQQEREAFNRPNTAIADAFSMLDEQSRKVIKKMASRGSSNAALRKANEERKNKKHGKNNSRSLASEVGGEDGDDYSEYAGFAAAMA